MDQIGLSPHAILPADIDESPRARETPRALAERLATGKLAAAAARPEAHGAYVLAGDTVVAVGRRILPKAETEGDVRTCLDVLSGRTHRVFSAVAAGAPDGRAAARVSESRVTFKRLSAEEVDAYVASGDGRGKAGGYAVQGPAGAFVIRIIGSYSGIVGLPLYETAALLGGLGYRAGA